MGIILQIIKNLRYLVNKKALKRWLTFIIIIILFMLLASKVFAFELKDYTFQDFYQNYSGHVFDTANNFENYDSILIDFNGNSSSVANARYCVLLFNKTDTEKLKFSYQENAFDSYTSYAYFISYAQTGQKVWCAQIFYDENFNILRMYYDSKVFGVSGGNGDMFTYGDYTDISPIVSYSSLDVYKYATDEIIQNAGSYPPEVVEPYPLSVRVDEGDYTYVNPIHAYTNWFSREDIENYSAEVSLKTDFSDSKQMYIGTLFIQESQELLCRFMYDIEHNGTYYFKITNNETGKDNYFSITVRNMLGAGTIDENGDIIPPTVEEVQEIDENKYVIGIGETAQDTNKFLKDDNVNDNEFNMPTVDVNDPTANFFDTIFTGLYNAVTSNEEKTISFDLFGNQIQINSADFNFLTDSRFNLLRFILSSAWVVGIGLYILKDIRKMIDKIKDGNIEGVANDDIKADIM